MAYNVFTSSRRATGASGGFALVAVLMLAVLLTLVVVALFSLLNVETQNGSNVALRNQARQNALTGLDLALGELQKQMGPDKRISASAAFLDSKPTTPEIDGVTQPNWVGVWDSYLWPVTLPSPKPPATNPPNTPNQAGGVPPTYDKTTTFRRWLVSMPASTDPKNINLPKAPDLNSSNSVTLVGSGTVKPKASEVAEVKAWKVDGDKDSTGNQGHYAWWVGDEGMKAKVNYPAPNSTAISNPSIKQVIDLGTQLRNAPRTALEAADAYSALKPKNATDYTKALTFPSLSLVFKNNTTPGDFTKAFYDYTVYSKGVLSDVQNGGLKRDLNLLLELPKANLPSFVRTTAGASTGYQQIYYYTLPAQGTTPPTPITNMGPDWGLIYRYYNLYKSPYLEYDSKGFVFYMDKYNYEVALASDITAKSATNDGLHDFILPQTLRIQYLYGFFNGPVKKGEKQYFVPVEVDNPATTDPNDTITKYTPNTTMTIPTGDVLYMVCYPTLQLWNPYNIRLRSSTKAEFGTNPPAPIGGNYPTNVWSLPIPPLSLLFEGEATWRPLLATSGAAADSIFQPYGGSMCTNWLMSGGGTDFVQIVMDPGTTRVFGIKNYTDSEMQQMYWQDQVDTTSGTAGATPPFSTTPPFNISSPKRAFDYLGVWNSSSTPPYSNFLSNNGEHHIAAPSTVKFQVKWTLDNTFSLRKTFWEDRSSKKGTMFTGSPDLSN